MTPNQIFEALSSLNALSAHLDDVYTDNGGEVTDYTENLEAEKAALQNLLAEGVDDLGRWLKSKEDLKATYKAEKAAADAKIKSCDNTIEYIKGLISTTLEGMGQTEAKGSFYKFSRYQSSTTKADAATLRERWQDAANEAIHNAGIPAYVTCTLGASVTLVPEGEDLPDVFIRTERDTVKFTKPRKAE